MPNSTSQPRIWVLADDRTGNANQAIGVAEALGLPFEIKRLEYSRWGRLPNLIRAASLLGVQDAYREGIKPPWPDLVIAAGRRTVPIARYIKRANHQRTFLTHIMWPGSPVGELDLLAVPEHDQVAPQPNIIHTLGAPHRVTAVRLTQDTSQWRERFAHLPRPHIGVLVGGTAGKQIFDAAAATLLGKHISQMARDSGGSLLVTTSRRTGAAASNALVAAITAPAFLHLWTRDNSAAQGRASGGRFQHPAMSMDGRVPCAQDALERPSGDTCGTLRLHSSPHVALGRMPEAPENPFFAFLGLSDVMVVTGDSTSMCSEACATGRPVYIFAPPDNTAPKHKHLHQRLYTLGYAKPLSGTFETWSYPPLNAADMIARAIVERVGL